MGVTLDPTRQIAGYRPSIFKDALRAYLRTINPTNLVDLKSVFPHRRDGAIVFEECLDRGLIDATTLELTEAGMSIARAKVQARTPFAKARLVLDDFIDRVDQFNNDPEAVSQVDQIWLFGSLMREEATVGDIDLAITRRSRIRDLDERLEQAKRLLARIKDAPKRWAMPRDRIDWLFRRAIFGARRHPLLAGAQDETSDLASLAVPCRLIYDQSRGGRVHDPILPRHPESNGRSDTVSPPAELPDLKPAELRPMDARWVTGFKAWSEVSPCCIFRGWTDECHKLFPHYPKRSRVVADDHELHNFPWTPKTIKRAGLDGRSSVAIINATEWWGTCITLHRLITSAEDKHELKARFSDLLLHRRRTIEPSTLPDIAAVTSLILAVDAERILRRRIELGMTPQVTIRISQEGLSDELKTDLAGEVVNTLSRRAVAIEPIGHAASVEIELI
jgi:hypothetical protein